MPILAITGNDGQIRTVAIKGLPEVAIGRAPGNTVVLADARISRRHAVIHCKSGVYVLGDCGSAMGTLLNGVKLSAPQTLQAGDEIVIGDHTLQFQDGDEGARAAPPRRAGARKALKDDKFADVSPLYTNEMMDAKKRIHEAVLGKLRLAEIATAQIQDEEMRIKLEAALDEVLREIHHELPRNIAMDLLRQTLLDELIGYGPISPMLRDSSVNEIMVNGPSRIFVERNGKLFETGARFFNDRHMMTIIQRIVEPLGRHIDEASAMVDARLPDGSRVNAIIPPLTLDGPALTVRKFAAKKMTTDDLVSLDSMTPEIACFLEEAVRARQNIMISGGTGSGKTTLLNVMSQFIPIDERVVTIEDSAELKLTHRNLVRMEARPANVEGRGRVAIRDLLANALRMRPDRIVVGECRGAEALDMLQAMNTGHDGSMTTIHANNPRDALARLENLVMMAGFELPSIAIREQISSAIDLVIQQTRMVDGRRKITQISELTGRENDVVLMQDVFRFEQTGFSDKGEVSGHYAATGNIPRFIEKLKQKNDLRLNMNVFVPQ